MNPRTVAKFVAVTSTLVAALFTLFIAIGAAQTGSTLGALGFAGISIWMFKDLLDYFDK